MSISTDVSVEMLNECFELGAFHGLREPHADDVTEPPETPVASPCHQTRIRPPTVALSARKFGV